LHSLTPTVPVIRQAGVGAAQLGHPVIPAMGLVLAGEQLADRPRGTKPREVGGVGGP
jgi:hypothetical protein